MMSLYEEGGARGLSPRDNTMFCPHCGKEIADGSVFCGACGSSITLQEAPVQPAQEAAPVQPAQEAAPVQPAQEAAPVQPAQEAVPVQPAQAAAPFAQPTFEEAPLPKKSKKGKIIALVSVVSVLAVLAALIVPNLSYLMGHFIKIFGSEEDYLKFVEAKSLTEYVDVGTLLYGDVTQANQDTSGRMTMDLQIGEEAKLLAGAALGGSFDADWLNGITLITESKAEDGNVSSSMKLNMGDVTLLDLVYLLDAENSDMYIGLRNLTNKYLVMDMDQTGNGMLQNALMNIDRNALIEALPSEDELNDKLVEYLEVALDGLGDVKMSDEDVTVDGHTENLTVLRYDITEQDVANMATNVLKALKEDKDIQQYCDDLESFVITESQRLGMDIDFEKGEAYREFMDAVDDAIDDLDGARDRELFTLIDYVNGSHEIVGRAIRVEGEEILHYVTASEGSDYAFEMIVPGALEITGTGEEDGGALTGTYEVIVDGVSVATIGLEEFSSEDQQLNGSIVLTPSDKLMRQLMRSSGMDSSVSSMLNPSLKLSFVNDGDASSVSIGLMSNQASLVTLTFSYEEAAVESIGIPDKGDTYAVEDAEDWASTIDLGKLVDALQQAGLPDELISVLRNALGSAL